MSGTNMRTLYIYHMVKWYEPAKKLPGSNSNNNNIHYSKYRQGLSDYNGEITSAARASFWRKTSK